MQVAPRKELVEINDFVGPFDAATLSGSPMVSLKNSKTLWRISFKNYVNLVVYL